MVYIILPMPIRSRMSDSVPKLIEADIVPKIASNQQIQISNLLRLCMSND